MSTKMRMSLLFPVILVAFVVIVILGFQWPGYSDRAAQTPARIPNGDLNPQGPVSASVPDSHSGLPIPIEVVPEPSEIQPSTTELVFSAVRGQDNPPAQTFEIAIIGANMVPWSIEHNSTWLAVDPGSGNMPQTISCTPDIAGLSSRDYFDTLRVTAPAAANSPQMVFVHLTIDEPDTLFIPEMTGEPSQQVVVPIILTNVDSITEISLPLRYDKGDVQLGMVTFGEGRITSWTSKFFCRDTATGTAKIFATSCAALPPDDPLPPGSGAIGYLRFFIPPDARPGTVIDIDTATLDLSPLWLGNVEEVAFVPRVVPGRILISERLDILVEPREELTPSLEVINYPNPFNSETVIFIQGKVDPQARLVVYDILGRSVRDLSACLERAGIAAEAVWDGCDNSGQPLGSGIYFGVLRSAQSRVTQKILLLR